MILTWSMMTTGHYDKLTLIEKYFQRPFAFVQRAVFLAFYKLPGEGGAALGNLARSCISVNIIIAAHKVDFIVSYCFVFVVTGLGIWPLIFRLKS